MLGSNKKVYRFHRKCIFLNQFHGGICWHAVFGTQLNTNVDNKITVLLDIVNTTTKNLLFKAFHDQCFNVLNIKKQIITSPTMIGSLFRFRVPGFSYQFLHNTIKPSFYTIHYVSKTLKNFDHDTSAWDTHTIVIRAE